MLRAIVDFDAVYTLASRGAHGSARARSAAQAPGEDAARSFQSVVFVVDGDPVARESVCTAATSAGCRVEAFCSADEFLSRPCESIPHCIVLDATLRSADSLDLQQQLAAERPAAAVIVIARDPDIPMAVRAMKAGAIEYLVKPTDHEALQNAITRAIDCSRAAHRKAAGLEVIRSRHASLTPRERAVMALVVAGRLNKQVAGELGISEVTVKAHRGSAMRKMGARSFANLVSMAEKLGLTSA
jgi:FixJ family two-component response regulator